MRRGTCRTKGGGIMRRSTLATGPPPSPGEEPAAIDTSKGKRKLAVPMTPSPSRQPLDRTLMMTPTPYQRQHHIERIARIADWSPADVEQCLKDVEEEEAAAARAEQAHINAFFEAYKSTGLAGSTGIFYIPPAAMTPCHFGLTQL